MKVNNVQLKNIVSAILFLFLCSFLSGQTSMGIVHQGAYTIPSYQFDVDDVYVVRGDTLVIYKASLAGQELSIDKISVYPDGTIQTLSPFYSFSVPSEYGEFYTIGKLSSFQKDNQMFYTLVTKQHLLIFEEQAEQFFLHDIDFTSLDFENSHLFSVHVQDENFAYLTIKQYPPIDIYFRTIKIDLNTNQAMILNGMTEDLNQSPLVFQAIGDYTLAFQTFTDTGNDFLIHNGTIIQTIYGGWDMFNLGYQDVQNFSNHYFFMIEYNTFMYGYSLIAWIENDSLHRRGFSSSMFEGDMPDFFNGIHTIDDQHFLTHFISEYSSDEFRTYQINLLNNFNLFEESPMFPDLSTYGQALSLVSMNDQYAIALSRGNNTDIHFNLVDFVDQDISTYPFTFDNSSSNNFGYIYHSENYVYITYQNRVNIFKLEQVQHNDDQDILPLTVHANVYPNPFYQSCQIKVKSSVNTPSEIAIYNIKGQKIRTFNYTLNDANDNIMTWDGKNSDNVNVSAGIYFVKVKTNQTEITKKILKIN